MFTVYVLKSVVAPKSHAGITNHLSRRLNEHNSHKHTYTKWYAPWHVFYTEQFDDFSEGRKRKVYLKTTRGRKFLKKIFETS